MSLFGIESEYELRRELDDLLELHAAAQQRQNKETIGTLKSRLKDFYRRAMTARKKQSYLEASRFCLAIQEALAYAPNLNDPSSWQEGLDHIGFILRHYLPSCGDSAENARAPVSS